LALRAKGKIIHGGKRIALGEAEVREKMVVAKGLVTYVLLDLKRPSKVS